MSARQSALNQSNEPRPEVNIETTGSDGNIAHASKVNELSVAALPIFVLSCFARVAKQEESDGRMRTRTGSIGTRLRASWAPGWPGSSSPEQSSWSFPPKRLASAESPRWAPHSRCIPSAPFRAPCLFRIQGFDRRQKLYRGESTVDCSLTMLENEENLQAAFKKLRVDSEQSTASLPASGGTSPGSFIETTDKSKVKMTFGSKESWHWCLRKPLRGAVRTQRRRRSKSPVLHPPRFIHCTKQMPSCSQSVHKNPTDVSESNKDSDTPSTFSKNEQASHPLEFVKKQTDFKGSEASVIGIQKSISENCSDAGVLPTQILKATDLSNFQSASEQNKGNFGACVESECQCKQWQNMNVYMFSDAQNSPQCASERTAHVQDNSQPLPPRISSSSARSCSEQARAQVDDVTIEDLSGYMENFLHIPKEMSHMAEMMYT